MELLFTVAHWHALAKLCMHNDLTLDVLDALTASLGKKLCDFSTKTCPKFETKELRREFNARVRREAKKLAPDRQMPAAQCPQEGTGSPSSLNTSMHLTTAQQISVDGHVPRPNANMVPETSAVQQLSVSAQGTDINHLAFLVSGSDTMQHTAIRQQPPSNITVPTKTGTKAKARVTG